MLEDVFVNLKNIEKNEICHGEKAFCTYGKEICSYSIRHKVSCEYIREGKYCDNMFELPGNVLVYK